MAGVMFLGSLGTGAFSQARHWKSIARSVARIAPGQLLWSTWEVLDWNEKAIELYRSWERSSAINGGQSCSPATLWTTSKESTVTTWFGCPKNVGHEVTFWLNRQEERT